jgi:hypothetical protein
MVDTDNPKTLADWIACIPLPKYLAKIPSGKLMPIGGDVIWIDGNGDELTAEEYKTVHGADPALIWAAKKEYIKKNGGGVHVG